MSPQPPPPQPYQQQPYQSGPAYQPPPGFAPPPGPPPNPAASKRQRLLIFGAVGIAVAAMAVIAVLNPGGGTGAGGIDVTITDCEASGSENLPTAKISFTVHNGGRTAESARIKIEYRDGSGARIDTDQHTVRSVAPGDTVRVEESTVLDAAPSGSLTCRITDVS